MYKQIINSSAGVELRLARLLLRGFRECPEELDLNFYFYPAGVYRIIIFVSADTLTPPFKLRILTMRIILQYMMYIFNTYII